MMNVVGVLGLCAIVYVMVLIEAVPKHSGCHVIGHG